MFCHYTTTATESKSINIEALWKKHRTHWRKCFGKARLYTSNRKVFFDAIRKFLFSGRWYKFTQKRKALCQMSKVLSCLLSTYFASVNDSWYSSSVSVENSSLILLDMFLRRLLFENRSCWRDTRDVYACRPWARRLIRY